MHNLANYIHASNAYALALKALADKVRAVSQARLKLTRALEDTDAMPGDLVRAFYVAQREEREALALVIVQEREREQASDELFKGLEVRNG